METLLYIGSIIMLASLVVLIIAMIPEIKKSLDEAVKRKNEKDGK